MPFRGGIVIQAPWAGPVSVNSDWPEVNWNLRKDAAEMGAVVTGAGTVGGGCAEVWNVLHLSGSGGDPLRVRVVGHVPADWEDAGRI